MSEINFHLIDCMDFMQDVPDKFYDLAIVDPPYGIGFSNEKERKDGRFRGAKKSGWDNAIPDEGYFNELFRVSKDQIIWGGNYFPHIWLKPSRGFIFWYKGNPVDNFADGELAWTSFDRVAKQFNYRYYGNIEGGSSCKHKKIHITQKPIDLYRWLLRNYAKPGQKILDTHGGSMSHAIACDMEGFDLDIIEKDAVYFNDAIDRFNAYKQQLKLF